jgi:phosphatidylinositol alpha-1,6-mannosyltransferase
VTELLVSEVFPPRTGGSGRWFWEIYRRLPREGFLIAAGETPGQEDFDAGHDLNIRRMPLSLPSWGILNWSAFRGYWRAIGRLRDTLRSNRVRRLHCGRCLPEGLMGLALRVWQGTPYICYVHGEEMNCAAGSRELRLLAQRVLDHAQFVIANSRNSRQILLDQWGVSPSRIRLLHPGVDTGRFVPAPRSSIERELLGWGERRVMLTVGRLQKRKGHDMVIRALRQIRETVPDILYAIVGDGEERKTLEDIATAEGVCGNVQFCDELDDAKLIKCYQQCDLFVLANRQVGEDIEGFGIVLLEAQACGRAVIAGRSGGTAETMRIPESGCVLNCEHPKEIASVVAQLLAAPSRLEAMGAAGRAWATTQFDWSKLAMQASSLFAQS